MSQLVKIGNSQGVRIPKPLVQQACLEGVELELKLVEGGILIAPKQAPRTGWAESIQQALATSAEKTDVEWLDAGLTKDEDWEW